MWEREQELQETSLLINDLEVKLNGLPATNTFEPRELYMPPTDQELERAGIITELDGVDPRFTEKGLLVYKTMDRMKRKAVGELTGRFPIASEERLKSLSLEIWQTVKGAYVGN